MRVSPLVGGNRPAAFPTPFSPTDLAKSRAIEALKARDRQVRAHEAAHLAAAGGLALGGASFTYQQGPDGKSYAIGGEVTLDTSPVPGDPRATLAKAQQIQAAALAPADPSPQDRSVAAAAAAMAIQAQQDLQKAKAAESLGQNLDVVA
ncbi:hypothetical protein GETHLI_35450 [Geothrix limicola]|uniref:SprA-related family protein n=1 Tax=Geothrix limicola TaxID=2927978 RepID=A0ABQ5QK09_9BACT|nr:putative metalloprotease CJM1_0395 family protein [Geothrix limicola]GLH75042.1 hypothetical protein GETHLI_35450 [Geothrix limicola]